MSPIFCMSLFGMEGSSSFSTWVRLKTFVCFISSRWCNERFFVEVSFSVQNWSLFVAWIGFETFSCFNPSLSHGKTPGASGLQGVQLTLAPGLGSPWPLALRSGACWLAPGSGKPMNKNYGPRWPNHVGTCWKLLQPRFFAEWSQSI